MKYRLTRKFQNTQISFERLIPVYQLKDYIMGTKDKYEGRTSLLSHILNLIYKELTNIKMLIGY
jgi:hypothetical protein